ncbi:McrC family protein [Methylobacterium sp. Leaf99]|uniref:McrC family protein n=1 Tax=Methylobacterium sp. Leaf99 TaxID=1736251 RepID=UPI001FCD9E93|nr:McrC family protein [Methylobacterium sp. Leaf99]
MLLPVGARRPDDEPIAVYESTIGRWRAGRYIGELQFENGILRIEPRFGMPSLLRWLGEIWGMRLFDGGGALKEQGLWLWVIIAHLWGGKLSAAAKHGLPYRRSDAIHIGPAMRGKLLPIQTALVRAVRDDHLVSKTRIRVVDRLIGEITLLAAQHLNGALGTKGRRASWLSERGRDILDELKSFLGTHRDEGAVHKAHSIRYTPITEGYRPLVEISLSILARKPRLPEAAGKAQSHGLLLDMAEIWELYIAKLLQAGLPYFRVLHTGRTKHNFQWLLTNGSGGVLQSLRPDIVVLDNHDQCLAIVDAKYKNTRSNSNNVNGVLREDLYQLSAYLSGFGNPGHRLEGILIYPEDDDGQVKSVLSSNNPWWLTSNHNRYLSFMSVDGTDTAPGSSLSGSEQVLIRDIEARLGLARE